VSENCARCDARGAHPARLTSKRRSDYELMQEFDVYGTGGDTSSCIREMKQQLHEAREEVAQANRERSAPGHEARRRAAELA
jgi:bacterioferritin-associated ferredoxin